MLGHALRGEADMESRETSLSCQVVDKVSNSIDDLNLAVGVAGELSLSSCCMWVGARRRGGAGRFGSVPNQTCKKPHRWSRHLTHQ